MRRRVFYALLGLPLTAAVALSCFAMSASAAAPSTGWSIGSVAEPTNFSYGAPDRYALTVVNVGSRPSEGVVTITDELPSGIAPSAAKVEEPLSGHEGACSLTTPLTCSYSEPLSAGNELVVNVKVAVLSPSLKGSVINEAAVAGGGGSGASTSESTPVNAGQASFGIEQFAFAAGRLDGTSDTQAGDHPYGVTTTIDLNTVFGSYHLADRGPAQEVKDVAVDLPMGFVGDPAAAEQCPQVDLTNTEGAIGRGDFRADCPAGSKVGTVRLVWGGGDHSEAFPVYNVVPGHGYPAELGFNAGLAAPIYLYASVVPGTLGYRLQVGTPAALRVPGYAVEGISLTVFGDPAEQDGSGGSAAFVTNPADCSAGPLSADVQASSWDEGQATAEARAYPALTGCDLLQGDAAFDPSLQVAPETTQADTPSGYEFDLKLPQGPSVFGALATPDLRNATVTLPAGVSISPSLASGPHALEGCTAAQIDLLGTELGEGHPGGNHSPYDDGLAHGSPGHCPQASILGTVEATSPLVAEPLVGHVYLAAPRCGSEGEPACTEADAANGNLYGLYIELAGSGVIVKFPGTVSVDPATGRVTTSFENLIQVPVSDVKLRLSGGPRASLANPQACGVAPTVSDLAPWSAPFTPDATPSSSFNVDWDGNGGPCPGLPFAPGFTAGTVTPSAGAFSPLTVTFSRGDREQDLSGVSVRMPPGLLGVLKSVPLCGEPQAAQGTCGAESLIGHTTVTVGAGSSPLSVTGQVFLTGPYKGAPFGLSIVVPAIAGPFNLGNVVVRAAIAVDPHTAQVTVTSDPLPQIVDGVPLRVRTVNVTVDRSGFIFNPTNCSAQQVTATITPTQGASAAVASPFTATGCAGLAFHPSFTVSTQASTSKKNGASLDVKVSYPQGAQANIHSVAVTLPKQLPSRLTTIQQACPEAAFAANPASCPAGSVIGTATAHTPLLASPVTGPAYLVSHGGAAFPDLVVILQGEGVTLDLLGTIDIKKGLTSSTFASVPDAPISSFELSLPKGPHSGLAAIVPAKAKGNLCGQSLVMPTTLTGQNGAQVKQSTKIRVTGCPKAKKAKKKAKPRHRKARKKR